MRMPKTIGLSLALLVASSAAIAKQNKSVHHHPAPTVNAKAAPGTKAKAVKAKAVKKRVAAAQPGTKREKASGKSTARSQRKADRRRHASARRAVAALPPAERGVGPVWVAGQREIGRAAWYGRHHVGKRTASGEPLDTVRATAAHRTLPLHSLVRVTNLSNGRSVIATINDRGPVSRSLLIDMSPRAADELDMKRAGIVEVAVEPVVPAGGFGSSSTP